MTRRQQGFTLVEIAIVLVIIGLLLGGILKGQELINSARVRNIADTNSGIQAAYFGFIDRYRAVPGDMCQNLASNAIGQSMVSGGNGNGRLDSAVSGCATANSAWNEGSAVWEHLWKAGFIQGSYDGGATDLATYRTMSPSNPFNGNMVLFITSDYMEYVSSAPAVSTSKRLNLVLGRQIPVNIARELDVKVDDAKPFSGILRLTTTGTPTFGDLGLQNDGSTPCHGTTALATANEYNIEKGAQDCNLAYLY
jgi:prepilin-type N-terminal cleavage/methylation domain-containing protein